MYSGFQIITPDQHALLYQYMINQIPTPYAPYHSRASDLSAQDNQMHHSAFVNCSFHSRRTRPEASYWMVVRRNTVSLTNPPATAQNTELGNMLNARLSDVASCCRSLDSFGQADLHGSNLGCLHIRRHAVQTPISSVPQAGATVRIRTHTSTAR